VWHSTLVKRIKFWLIPWLGFWLCIGVSFLLTGRSIQPHLPFLLTSLGLFVIGIVGWLPRRFVSILFGVYLVILLIAGLCEQVYSRISWAQPGNVSFATFIPIVFGHGEFISNNSFRFWETSNVVNHLSINAKVRMVGSVTGWMWEVSDQNIVLKPDFEGEQLFTQVVVPEGKDPYLQLLFDGGNDLAGASFRVSLEMRAATPIPAIGCRGVWLQVWGKGGGALCKALEISSEWQTYSHEWTVPETAQSRYVRIILNDFEGLSFDVRNVHLFELIDEKWVDVGPLIGSGPVLQLKWGEGEANARSIGLASSDSWSEVAFSDSVAIPQHTRIEGLLKVPKDMAVEVKELVIEPSSAIKTVPKKFRSELWYGHPNLLGHSIAVQGLTFVALTPYLLIGTLGSFISIFLISMSGSRTALFSFLFSIIPLTLMHWRTKRIWIFALSVPVFILGLFWASPFFLERFSSLDESEFPRQMIWQATWSLLFNHPLGNVEIDLGDYLKQMNPDVVDSINAPQHAHNFWLELSRQFGIPGFIGAVWLSVGLAIVAWKLAGWIGLAIILALFILQITDYTFFFTGLTIPFILSLNTFFVKEDV
jgi:hypothetical protein